MNANLILLQKKYARVVWRFAEKEGISLDRALELFYRSQLYTMLREGVSDLHCMSDEYLAEELEAEYRERNESYKETQHDQHNKTERTPGMERESRRLVP